MNTNATNAVIFLRSFKTCRTLHLKSVQNAAAEYIASSAWAAELSSKGMDFTQASMGAPHREQPPQHIQAVAEIAHAVAVTRLVEKAPNVGSRVRHLGRIVCILEKPAGMCFDHKATK